MEIYRANQKKLSKRGLHVLLAHRNGGAPTVRQKKGKGKSVREGGNWNIGKNARFSGKKGSGGTKRAKKKESGRRQRSTPS